MNRNDLNSTSRTNWAALESRSEENIDYSDIPPLTDEFFERAILRIPADTACNLVQLDPDVKQWFQDQGEQYKTLINNVLRQYIENIESKKTQHSS
ncbi:MAG: BrnA antitoxin family protein [Snowella sp.]|nr:BrnA antitoxin family protein [Snowella sp.]